MDFLAKYITLPELLLWIPIFGGLICFFIKDKNKVQAWAFAVSIIELGVMVLALFYFGNTNAETPNKAIGNSFFDVSWVWMKNIGASFSLDMRDGVTRIMCLLTALCFPIIILASRHKNYSPAHVFYGLLLLSIGGIIGVFIAHDALTFYFFWELALIPVYFLASIWGGEKRIQASFKFFIYTFLGSLFLLAGILYVYSKTNSFNSTSGHSFAWTSFSTLDKVLSTKEQIALFLCFFLAFAIKMPIFPLHTWQPLAYEQSPTPVTMIMSALMVKMGLFAALKWLVPVLPEGNAYYGKVVIILSIIGILYASLIAIKQNNLKRIVAYSSIAHIGLMCASIFVYANNQSVTSYKGLVLQMFNHGINVLALWYILLLIEKYTGTQKLNELGGLAKNHPTLTLFLVIFAFANVAAPLTNAFIGEFLMFNGLFQYNKWLAVIAGLSIILSAVYTLRMVQKAFYGESNIKNETNYKLEIEDVSALCILLTAILVMGVYAQPIFNLIDLKPNIIN